MRMTTHTVTTVKSMPTTAGCDANLYPRTILFFWFCLDQKLFLCCQALLVNGELMRRPGVALAAELCANDMFFCLVKFYCYYSNVFRYVFYMLVWRNGLAQCAH